MCYDLYKFLFRSRLPLYNSSEQGMSDASAAHNQSTNRTVALQGMISSPTLLFSSWSSAACLFQGFRTTVAHAGPGELAGKFPGAAKLSASHPSMHGTAVCFCGFNRAVRRQHPHVSHLHQTKTKELAKQAKNGFVKYYTPALLLLLLYTEQRRN